MNEPIFSDDALRQLRGLRVYDQRKVVDAIRKQLIEADARQVTSNKFPLRRASEYADYELRVGSLRVFYRLASDGTVILTLIGVKRGNQLLIEGEEFDL